MRRLHRTLFLAALVLALSACATRSTVQEPIQAPAPAVVGPSPAPANAIPRCLAGNGLVVRMTSVDPANDPANAMNGGVLGGVLGGDKPAHPTVAGNGPSHDIYVQMDDGRKLIVSQRELGGIGQGSRVTVDEGCRARLLR